MVQRSIFSHCAIGDFLLALLILFRLVDCGKRNPGYKRNNIITGVTMATGIRVSAVWKYHFWGATVPTLGRHYIPPR